MNLDDAVEWIDMLMKNNPEGDSVANFLRWHDETKHWRAALETNNPDANSF